MRLLLKDNTLYFFFITIVIIKLIFHLIIIASEKIHVLRKDLIIIKIGERWGSFVQYKIKYKF